MGLLKGYSSCWEQPLYFSDGWKFRAPTCGSGRTGPSPTIHYHRTFGIWQVVRAWGLQTFLWNWSHQILKEKLHIWKWTETCYIPVATPCFLVFLLISYRQDICQFSYMQRHSDIFQTGWMWLRKKTNCGSILKSIRFCLKTRGEAESWGRENQIFMYFKRKAI